MKAESIQENSKESIGQAIMEIEAIKQRIQVTGSVDSEINLLNEIILNLKNGEIDSEEALRRARGVEVGRQDYH
ncbi:MAG: hypothetical protein HQ402_03835 [Parcubacteria group bacterium]|nr:hypothetical protein [Parcubacteria group bacterium]